METTLDISEARKKFNTLDQDLEKTPVIYITRRNKRAFVVVNADYFSTVMETMEVLADPEAMKMLEASIEDIRAKKLHDQKDVDKEAFLSVAEDIVNHLEDDWTISDEEWANRLASKVLEGKIECSDLPALATKLIKRMAAWYDAEKEDFSRPSGALRQNYELEAVIANILQKNAKLITQETV